MADCFVSLGRWKYDDQGAGMMKAGCRQLADGFALGVLDPNEAEAFIRHLSHCDACRREHLRAQEVLVRLVERSEPRPQLWSRINDFLQAPKASFETSSFRWEEVASGVELADFREEQARGVRARLMRAKPGSQKPPHRHLADEEILIIAGGLRVSGREYSTGEICHVRAGAEHIEEAVTGDVCLCYVLHRSSESPLTPCGALDPACSSCSLREIHQGVFLQDGI
jgi:anti-sigma factor ChrR (cupin superfamily)